MLSTTFAEILAGGRAQFNQRMVEARRRYPGLNTAGFSQFLQSSVDPVVAGVGLLDAGRAPSTACAAYDLALEMTGLALIGPAARSQFLATVWQQLAPQIVRLIAQQPGEVLGLLSNAAIYLESIPRTRCEQWLKKMIALSGRIETIAQLQAIGQILAWRAGVAHFRTGALDAANGLPVEMALAAFDGADGQGSWDEIRTRMLADPWWAPGAASSAVQGARMEIGEFTGFGGDFGVPPEVRAHPHGFTVRCEHVFHLLIADVYGAVLHPADESEHAALDAHKGDWKLKGALLRIGSRETVLDLPADGITVCCNAHTLAVTSPYTHAIRLFPLK